VNLAGADLAGATLPAYQITPEEGEFIAYKKVLGGVVLRLLITGARTSSLIGRKCRCDRATVLGVVCHPDILMGEYRSNHDYTFTYRVGEEVVCPEYNSDPRVECTTGIHFFVTQKEAEDYT
jgi:hypothetical protein